MNSREQEPNKIPILVVAGPTASGKTALAVELALAYDGEVVSADSMQIYKGMDIATAKPSEAEKKGVPHHLMELLPLEQSFSVADYVKQAGEVIRDIRARGKLPILCGGTGLYISSLVDNITFDDTGSDQEIRARLTEEARTLGNHSLWLRLNEIDPEAAASIHENNLPRVIRGLEVFELTGKTLTQMKQDSRLISSPYRACKIGLTASDRDYLYQRINRRVDEMVKAGLVEECRRVWEKDAPATAAQAIGYKELIPYFEGAASLDECIDRIKLETRHYAKRQLTWFRRVADISWVEIDKFDNFQEILENVKNIVAKSEIMCYNIE